MKKLIKLIFILLFTISGFNVYSQNIPVEDNIFKKFTSENGILCKVYSSWDSLTLHTQGERLIFYILFNIHPDSKINGAFRNSLERTLTNAFDQIYLKLNRNGIPKLPILNMPDEKSINSSIQRWISKAKGIEHFYAIQKLNINSNGKLITIKANNVELRKYNVDSVLDSFLNVENTKINVSGIFIPPSPPSDNIPKENETIARAVDSQINIFWENHENQKDKKYNYLKYNYLDLNEDIFKNDLKNSIDSLAPPVVSNTASNFLTRFLGNAHVTFYDSIPINTKEYDCEHTCRVQNTDLSEHEKYSLFRISASHKSHKKIKFPQFTHYVTIKDAKLRELFITYHSERYLSDISLPLESIFGDTLGQKFYYDIVRFFFGFTTALTIQDFDWIVKFYNDLAIRNYFPGLSDERFGQRSEVIGKANITEGYKYLFEKGYEVYVTLNEGNHTNTTQSTTKVYLEDEWKSLDLISSNKSEANRLKNRPAFYLMIKMEQIWRTIQRWNQEIRLEDKANVNFTLLCLNTKQLENWIEEGKYDEHTVFTFGFYLRDLWDDMLNNEKIEFRDKYLSLYQFLNENNAFLDELRSNNSKKNIKSVHKKLSSVRRFKNVKKCDIENFLISNLRNRVHNRRFLFNICYLKILYQYTYDSKTDQLTKVPNRNLMFLEPVN